MDDDDEDAARAARQAREDAARRMVRRLGHVAAPAPASQRVRRSPGQLRGAPRRDGAGSFAPSALLCDREPQDLARRITERVREALLLASECGPAELAGSVARCMAAARR